MAASDTTTVAPPNGIVIEYMDESTNSRHVEKHTTARTVAEFITKEHLSANATVSVNDIIADADGSTPINEGDTGNIEVLVGDVDGEDVEVDIVTQPTYGTLGEITQVSDDATETIYNIPYTHIGTNELPDSFTFRAKTISPLALGHALTGTIQKVSVNITYRDVEYIDYTKQDQTKSEIEKIVDEALKSFTEVGTLLQDKFADLKLPKFAPLLKKKSNFLPVRDLDSFII